MCPFFPPLCVSDAASHTLPTRDRHVHRMCRVINCAYICHEPVVLGFHENLLIIVIISIIIIINWSRRHESLCVIVPHSLKPQSSHREIYPQQKQQRRKEKMARTTLALFQCLFLFLVSSLACTPSLIFCLTWSLLFNWSFCMAHTALAPRPPLSKPPICSPSLNSPLS